MTRAREQLLAWLRQNCGHDRVISNALNTGRVENLGYFGHPLSGWVVRVISRHGIEFFLAIIPYPVGAEPCSWGRMGYVPWELWTGEHHDIAVNQGDNPDAYTQEKAAALSRLAAQGEDHPVHLEADRNADHEP